MSLILRVAALVLFILAAVFLAASVNADPNLTAALVPAGLACWVGSTLVP